MLNRLQAVYSMESKFKIIITDFCLCSNFRNFSHELCFCFFIVAVKLNQYSWKKNFDQLEFHVGNRKIASDDKDWGGIWHEENSRTNIRIQYTILLDHSYLIGLIPVTKNRKHMAKCNKILFNALNKIESKLNDSNVDWFFITFRFFFVCF